MADLTKNANKQMVAAAAELSFVIEQAGEEVGSDLSIVIGELKSLAENKSASVEEITEVFRKLDAVRNRLTACEEELGDSKRINELLAMIEKERHHLVHFVENVKSQTGIRTKTNALEHVFE